MKQHGFTLIELLAVIVILAVIALIAGPIILGLIEDSKKDSFKASVYGISQAAKNTFVEIMYAGEEPINITFTYNNGVETSEPNGYNLNFEGYRPPFGQVSLTTEGQVALALHDGKYCATKGYTDAEVTITEAVWADCDMPGAQLVDKSGANVPTLNTGMNAVIWDGDSWISASNIDDSYKQNWYDYEEGKWANAKTADGSYWVWIPRYVYKISSGWHSSTTGTIEVQFSQGTNDNWNNAVIGSLDTGTGSSASNNKWTNHPAFTFGTTEVTGIWVAKFEATAFEGVANGYVADATCPTVGDNVTTKTIKSVPSATSWRCISIGNAFTTTRNMETNNTYGWGTSGSGIDTHLIKNTEWGAVTYLSKSSYGQGTNEIWINNANNYTTGCAGNSVSDAASTTGCVNLYSTTNGGKASTTGNIYGVYDMSGGAWEFVAAYLNNGGATLSNGSTITAAATQYKDIYTVTTDNQATNYTNAANKKGDALYETSNAATGNGVAWFNDSANMPYAAGAGSWFMRGARFVSTTQAGPYIFYDTSGVYSANIGFRPVLIVSSGL